MKNTARSKAGILPYGGSFDAIHSIKAESILFRNNGHQKNNLVVFLVFLNNML
ncbi:hypothetical protein G159_01375 [Planococcus glaciei CHR43]|nr:hypothetical protein G159_01375 [Planococcus glaciei CHR43]